MIKVEKDNYTLTIGYNERNFGLKCFFEILSDDKTSLKGFYVHPFALVRDYNLDTVIGEEMPTEEEAKEWLDRYIEEFVTKETND